MNLSLGLLLGSTVLMARGGTPTPPVIHTEYAQGMGVTADDGLVLAIPLPADGVARQIFVDAVNGSDGNNGLSPYVGHALNGTGPYLQYSATGQGDANAAYGPMATLAAAIAALPNNPAPVVVVDGGVGHQILLAEGQTFTDAGPASVFKNHYGKTGQPFVVQSYNPSQPVNAILQGRAKGSNRPKIIAASSGSAFANANPGVIGQQGFAVRGIEFVTATDNDAYNHGWISGQGNWLYENCVMNAVEISIDNGSVSPQFNIILRKCSIAYNDDAGQSKVCGMHIGSGNGFVLEDCVLVSNGLAKSLDRADTSGGYADIYKHCAYLSTGHYVPHIVRRNVMVEGSATGMSERGHVEAYHNVFIDNPTQMAAAGFIGPNPPVENPNGNWFDLHHNFVIGGQCIQPPTITLSTQPAIGSTITVGGDTASGTPTGGVMFAFVASGSTPVGNQIALGAAPADTLANICDALAACTDPAVNYVTWTLSGGAIRQYAIPVGRPSVHLVAGTGSNVGLGEGGLRGKGVTNTNGVSGATVRNNLFVNNPWIGRTNHALLEMVIQWNVPHYCDYIDNVGYAYATASYRLGLNAASGQTAPAEQDLHTETGTVNEATSPATTEQIYAYLGYRQGAQGAQRAALIADMIARPEEPWAARLLGAGNALFGFEFDFEKVDPPVFSGLPTLDDPAPEVGDVVTATEPTVTGGSVVFKEWRRNATPVPFAIAPAYTPTADDINQNLAYVMTAVGPGGFTTVSSALTQPVTTDYFTAIALAGGAPLSSTAQAAFTAYIDGLKSAGIWDRLRRLVIYGNGESNEVAALIDLRHPNKTWTKSGSPIFAPEGYRGDGVAAYLYSGENLAGDALYTQNDCHIMDYIIKQSTTSGDMFSSSAASSGSLIKRSTSASEQFAAQGGGITIADGPSSRLGFRMAVRSSATQMSYVIGATDGVNYHNTVSRASMTVASSASGIWGLRAVSSYSSDTIFAQSAGASLTPRQCLDYYNLTETLRAALGVTLG